MITVTVMKKQKNQKIRVAIFKNMGGNIPRGNFLGGFNMWLIRQGFYDVYVYTLFVMLCVI